MSYVIPVLEVNNKSKFSIEQRMHDFCFRNKLSALKAMVSTIGWDDLEFYSSQKGRAYELEDYLDFTTKSVKVKQFQAIITMATGKQVCREIVGLDPQHCEHIIWWGFGENFDLVKSVEVYEV